MKRILLVVDEPFDATLPLGPLPSTKSHAAALFRAAGVLSSEWEEHVESAALNLPQDAELPFPRLQRIAIARDLTHRANRESRILVVVGRKAGRAFSWYSGAAKKQPQLSVVPFCGYLVRDFDGCAATYARGVLVPVPSGPGSSWGLDHSYRWRRILAKGPGLQGGAHA